jgi:hypothetical protein
MLESVRNLRTSQFDLRQRLPDLERDWLVGRLCAQPGIAGAKCTGDTRRLTVEYDADRLVSADLVEFLDSCGVPVVAVHAGDA